MSKESLLMRDLAHAIDTLEAMVAFDYTPTKVSLSWDIGNATVGFKELSSAIAGVVADNWGVLRDEAILRQMLKVEELRKQLADEQAKGAGHAA